MQAWWLAKQREEQCESCNKDLKKECLTNIDCLLIKNIISSRLDILAIITVLKTQFPVFYNDLIAEPQLLKCIMWKLFNLKTCRIVENSQLENLTKKYLVINEDENYIINKKYSNLQSYLASIQNVTIPDDLKPFMMLLQDNLEREIGANTVPIYNALITQDYLRLREVLGINNNTDKLSNIQTSQIYRVLQQINSREDDDRMMKAYILLTKMSNLYYGNDAKLLTNDIVKTLFEKNYIEQVSINDIEIILNSENLLESNINKIFSYLITSLTNGKDILTLNEEQSKDYYKKVLDIGIKLHYSQQKLNKKNTEDLKALLNAGQYLYKENNSTTLLNKNIDIEFYINRIKIYGEQLLKDLGLNYISQLLNFLDEKTEDIDLHISEIDLILSQQNDKIISTKAYADIIAQGLLNNNSSVVIFFENIITQSNHFNTIDIDSIPNLIDNYAKRICINFSGVAPLEDIKTRIDKFICILNLYNKAKKTKN